MFTTSVDFYKWLIDEEINKIAFSPFRWCSIKNKVSPIVATNLLIQIRRSPKDNIIAASQGSEERARLVVPGSLRAGCFSAGKI